MSKQAPAAKDAPTSQAAPPAKSLVARLKIPGIILAIIVAEWIAASLYMPSASPPPQTTHADEEEAIEAEHADDSAHAAASDHGGHDAHGKKEEKADAHGGHGDSHDKYDKAAKTPVHSDQQEVDLGEFTVTGYQPVSNSTMFVTFRLYGTLKHKHADEFAGRLEEHKHRIRDNVIVIIRSAEVTDLTDAGLGLIKRRILETTNKTLGKPLLQTVVFSDFSFVEQ